MATDQIQSTGQSPRESAPPTPPAGIESSWPPAGDEQFWHASAPAGVRRHYASGDSAGGWKRWRRHLLGRCGARLAQQFAEKLAGSRKRAAAALLWGHSNKLTELPRLAWLLKIADARPRKSCELATEAPESIAQWLAATADRERWSPTANEAFEAVAWARALSPMARVCDGPTWWKVLERLHDLALAAALPLDEAEHADPLAHQLACGELPWSLAALFSEIEPCRQLAPAAAKALSMGIAELLDGTGVPHARHLAIFHPLVASWTRCRLLAAALDSKSSKAKSIASFDEFWNDDAEQEYFQAVREALRLARHGGKPVFSDSREPGSSEPGSSEPGSSEPGSSEPGSSEPGSGEPGSSESGSSEPAGGEPAESSGGGRSIAWLTDIAVELADDDKHYRRAMVSIAAGRGAPIKKNGKWKQNAKNMPDPAFHSEWAALAVLQTDWSPRSPRLTVDYSGPEVRIELQADRALVFSGVWELEVRVEGAPLETHGLWSEVCWLSDTDCDYLELEADLGRSRRVQRQMLLSRKDQFLFLADAILGEEANEMTYRGRLPLAAGVEVRPAGETRELALIAKKPRAVVLPLQLPEWRADPRGGSLAATVAEHVRPTTEKTVRGKLDRSPANGAAGTNGVGRTEADAAQSSHNNSNGAARSESDGRAYVGASAAELPAARLELIQSLHGARLFAPLWIDLLPKRVRNHEHNPLTWRQLTVAEQRRIVERDVAVGYRVQHGQRQWMAYRSLAAPGNRTLLGVNLSTEFFVGRFGSDGETESIVEIE